MDWIDASWISMATVSATLAFVDLSIWFRQRHLTVYLMFAVCSMSAATIAILELLMMRTVTPEHWIQLVRWARVPFAILLISLVGFVRLQFRASRRVWAVLAVVVSLASLSANFLTGANLNFRDVESLQSISIWGAAKAWGPVGERNPWMILDAINVALLIAFLIDTIIAVRGRGRTEERQQVIPVCGSIIVFLLLAGVWQVMLTTGLSEGPPLIAPPFICILLVMGYLIGSEILRAYNMATNLVTAESRLHESEQQMDLASSGSALGMWTWDSVGESLWLSPSARFLLGFSPGAGGLEVSQALAHTLHEDRERVRFALDEAMRGHGDIRLEFRVSNHEQDTRWIAALGKILFNQDHLPIHSYGVVKDITDRYMAEERFRVLVESMPSAIVLVNSEGAITFGNKRAESMFGYTQTQLDGMRIDSILPPWHLTGHDELQRRFFLSPDACAMNTGLELFALRKDGGEVEVEVAMTSVQIARDHFTLASITDISGRRVMEREMSLQRNELAHLSRAASLSALSSSLAHELNQPLTAILSNAQAGVRFLARQPADTDEVRVSFANVVDNAKRAGDVIRKLRSMLRNDRTEFIRLDANEVIQEVLQIVRSDLIERKVGVVLELATGLPRVKGDRVQLQQVLLNLMMNAADAMAASTDGHKLTLRTLAAENGAVEVQVEDAGCGISVDDLTRIFSPFVTDKKGGMGLGLSVCSMLIQAHGGKLWATNNCKRGATLHFRLPAYGDDLDAGTHLSV
jgi:two-component system, LuxR family, sensor kinase FixL